MFVVKFIVANTFRITTAGEVFLIMNNQAVNALIE